MEEEVYSQAKIRENVSSGKEKMNKNNKFMVEQVRKEKKGIREREKELTQVYSVLKH